MLPHPELCPGGLAFNAVLFAAFRLELVGPTRVTPVAVVTTVPDRAPIFRLVPRT